jgi:hypothetical protein
VLFALLLAILSPLASSSPDGLERMAEDNGFASVATKAPFSLIADYIMPGVSSRAIATILAALLGTIVLFGIGYGLTKAFKRRDEA